MTTSWEALRKMIGPFTGEIAARLRMSRGQLYKMQRRSGHGLADTGSRNELDRLEEGIRCALELGRSVEDAHAPIIYLEERFQRVGFVLPPECESLGTFAKAVGRSIREFGEFAQEVAEALGDDRITRAELERIVTEGHEGMRAMAAVLYLAEQTVREV